MNQAVQARLDDFLPQQDAGRVKVKDVRPRNQQAKELDIVKIEAELQELAGEVPVKVKVNNHLDVATSTKETDKGFFITFNPKRFRSPLKLEEHLNLCREAITWGQ